MTSCHITSFPAYNLFGLFGFAAAFAFMRSRAPQNADAFLFENSEFRLEMTETGNHKRESAYRTRSRVHRCDLC